jgi:hypothetical protein
MFTLSLSNWAQSLKRPLGGLWGKRCIRLPLQRPCLSELATLPADHLPLLIQESAVALKYLHLLGSIDWSRFPERPDQRIWPDFPALPLSAFAAACLVKIDQNLVYMSDLRQYLVEHPPLMWVLGFPLLASEQFAWGFDAEASLPTQRHFCRLLWQMPNAALQFLLDETVRLIQAELRSEVQGFGECISVDTKNVIAWVRENNPKTYIEGKRYDKTQQPKGDPDCRLGCKRKQNQSKKKAPLDGVPTHSKIRFQQKIATLANFTGAMAPV